MALQPGRLFFTQFEKELLLVLAKPYLNTIENKETNGVTVAKTAQAFREIAKMFNDTDGVTTPTDKQIRQCYLNLKKIGKKATCLRQERRKGGGEVMKQVELSTLEMRFLAELTLPISTLCDSDTSEMEILKSRDQSTKSAADRFVGPLTPSQSTSAEASELDASFEPSNECLEDTYNEMPQTLSGLVSETVEQSTPKPAVKNSLRENLMMFRKKTHKPTAPSASARAAACIEEHIHAITYMKKEEERKDKQAAASREEQDLRIELLREEIKLTKTKTLIQEKLLDLIEKNPGLSILSVLSNQ